MARGDLPESFYAVPLVERLKAIADMKPGTMPGEMPKWMQAVGITNFWSFAIAITETCREAAAVLDGIGELAEATKRNTELLKLLKERVILGGGIGHIHEDELAKLQGRT